MTKAPPKTGSFTPASATEVAELPVGKAVMIVPAPKGWAVFYIETQGNEIVRKSLIAGPVLKAEALEKLKVATVRYVLQGGQAPVDAN